MKTDPYTSCPVYETPHFILRLVRESDAEELLSCYADPKAIPFFHAENCTYGYNSRTVTEMEDTIRQWLAEYEQRAFVRWSVTAGGRAVGTVECFAMENGGALVRLDLRSDWEQECCLSELFEVFERKFYRLFGVDRLLTKGGRRRGCPS